jgi:hypothetical protein
MSNKPIILSLIIFLLFSFGFLAYTETKQQSPASQNWWLIYFSSPKDKNLDFVVENNSDQTNFHYEVSDGASKLKEADINIVKGEKKEIKTAFASSDAKALEDKEAAADKKITIRVSAGDDSKEIYKNFGK